MKVAIDARLLQWRFTGDRTYWRGLIYGLSRLHAIPPPLEGGGQGEGSAPGGHPPPWPSPSRGEGMADEYLLYTFPKMEAPDPAETLGLPIRPVNALTWRDWSLWAFPRAMKKDRVDVCHVQYSIPPFAPCPVITSVHDISFRMRPQYFRFKDRFLLDQGMRYGARYSAKILAISEYTKREILDAYGVPEQKVEVVYPGADEQFHPLDREASKALVREKYGIARPFIVSVGVLPMRKNIPCLIRAFARLKGILPTEHQLVIVGKAGGEEAGLRELASSLGVGDDVLLTGYLPDEDLPPLYNAADLSVYPSLYEGFGLPALEAMACGTPIITGNLSSLPEVVGDAGITVNPHEPDAFTEAMAKVLSDPSARSDMSARGLERAKTFSWEKMARRVADIYREVAGL